MDDNAAAIEAKIRGNTALKAKQYDDAIAEYSTAINLDPDNAVYYSNRCATYLAKGKSGDLKQALEDAENAIRCKRDWAKAYSRKGTVLCRMGKYDDAISTFEQAMEYSPGNTEYQQAIEDVKKSKSNRPSMGQNTLAYAQIAFNALVLLCSVVYLIPVVGGPIFFYHALKVSILAQLVTILRQCGTPKFNKEYGRQLVMNVETHYIMPAFVFHLSGPFVVALVPACLRAVLFLAQIAVYYDVPAAAKEQAQKLVAMGKQIRELNAQIEVGTGLLLILMLVTPQRNLFVLMFTWQYLRARYMISHDTKQAFAVYRQKLDAIFFHKYCPGFVGSLWTKGLGFLVKMGDIEAAQQSRCSVM